MKKSTCIHCNKPIKFVKGHVGYHVWIHFGIGCMRCDGRSMKSDLKGFKKADKAVPMSFNNYIKLIK